MRQRLDGQYRRLIGVHHRRQVFFTDNASPRRTLAIARPHRPLSLAAFYAGIPLSRLRAAHPLPAMPSGVLAGIELAADEATVVMQHDGRGMRLVAGLGSEHSFRWLLKAGEDAAIVHEAEMLALAADRVPSLVPRCLQVTDVSGVPVVVQQAVERSSRRRVSLAEATELCITLARHDLTHGDLAEWNVIRGGAGFVLCDWESGTDGLRPLHDLTHFVVQSGSLLGRWSSRAAVGLLVDDDSPCTHYARFLGLNRIDRIDALTHYLRTSLQDLQQGAAPAAYRLAMLRVVDGGP